METSLIILPHLKFLRSPVEIFSLSQRYAPTTSRDFPMRMSYMLNQKLQEMNKEFTKVSYKGFCPICDKTNVIQVPVVDGSIVALLIGLLADEGLIQNTTVDKNNFEMKFPVFPQILCIGCTNKILLAQRPYITLKEMIEYSLPKILSPIDLSGLVLQDPEDSLYYDDFSWGGTN
ncbi:TPA_asm: protein 4 [Aponogeton virus 1]|uniref:Protein 4 n=1 Tax=Aponogeton virus 1 TaxID=2977952 RepID=A0A9N7AB20_9RHAB|nr:TPA_asm: protein 4 [Aponogeton virus 1]